MECVDFCNDCFSVLQNKLPNHRFFFFFFQGNCYENVYFCISCMISLSRPCHWSSDRSHGEDLTQCCLPKHMERLEIFCQQLARITLVAFPVSMENLWTFHIFMCPKLPTQLHFTVDYFFFYQKHLTVSSLLGSFADDAWQDVRCQQIHHLR